jgi:predicted ATP-grasp superfamily ATP-dependent carboligase
VQALPLDRALATELPPSGAGWVVKPDDGSGAEDTWRFDDVDGVRRWARGRNDAARFIVQPYVPGIASSLSLLCRGGRATLLTCNRQNVRLDGGRFRYCGGIVGAGEARRPEYAPIAERIAAAIGELWGYVGVDLIESESGPVVLEINARLTMSYVGLREALEVNPAALVLRMLTDAATPPPAPRPVRECKVAIDVNAA